MSNTNEAIPLQAAILNIVKKPVIIPRIIAIFQEFFFSIFSIEIENTSSAKKKANIPRGSWSETPAIVLNKYEGIIARKKLDNRATILDFVR
ncbi:MAG: hypothetical protein BWY36_00486 [Candidatus Diapherotrites archaeon ADurb.Bin253]|nr:MAG: hypothetical protein BWY36_00486 [Candidatus Diapherotrites archaeon ADurb.Bin253]